MHETDIVVIGAGAAGVAAARRLHDARVPVVLLEARQRVGGRAWTWRDGDLALDLGCGWLHSADENEWARLAPKLGFTVNDWPPPWQRPAFQGNFSPAEQKEYWAAWHRFYQRIDEAIAAGGRQRMSDCLEPGGRWNAFLGAMVTYINGAEADQLIISEYAHYHDTERNQRIAQGYGALVEAYAAPVEIRRGCPVTLIDHSGARLRIVTPHGEIAARAVIVATPPGVIANESLRFAPALPAKLAAAQALPLGIADKVFLRVENADDLPVDTRLVGAKDTIETGSYTLRPFGRPVIEGYFGGRFARTLEGGIAQFAIEQVCAALGNDMRRRLSPIAESAWARDPFSLGSYSYGGVGAHAARMAFAEAVDARLFFAGEHTSGVDFSTAHGAYRTGVRAANEAMQALARAA